MSEGVGGNYFVPLPWQQYKITLVQVLTTQLKEVVIGEKEPQASARTRGLRSNEEFQPHEPPMQCGHDSLLPIVIDMVMGGLQYCDHLGPRGWRICSMVRSVGS